MALVGHCEQIKIIVSSHGVVCVCICHILSVNFNGQQNKSFDVTEINLRLKFSAEPVTAGNMSALGGYSKGQS